MVTKEGRRANDRCQPRCAESKGTHEVETVGRSTVRPPFTHTLAQTHTRPGKNVTDRKLS